MKITKTYKYKLRLTSNQRQRISSCIGSCRFVYNWSKSLRDDSYDMLGVGINYYDLATQLPKLKKQLTWLKDVDSTALQDALERQEKAYQSFFKGGGFPKWAKKEKYNSITIKKIQHDTHNRFKLPKIGSIKYYNSRFIPEGAKLKRCTIIKELDGYYICVNVEEKLLPVNTGNESQAIGIDWGVTSFLSLSNGEEIANLRYFEKYKLEIQRLQQSLSRKKKGGHNWQNVKKQIGKLHLKIKRSRKDWHHKISTDLTNRFGVIYVEDLNIKGMTKRPAPKLAEDGKTYLPNKAKAKGGLNRSILDTAPYQFSEQLKYKQLWKDQFFGRVRANGTSQHHHICGEKGDRKEKDFFCPKCQMFEDADINASKNILSRGNTTFANHPLVLGLAGGVESARSLA